MRDSNDGCGAIVTASDGFYDEGISSWSEFYGNV